MSAVSSTITPSFWKGKRVFLTGHTGFKGSWMSIWLKEMGADLTGFSLLPPTSPALFDDAGVASGMHSIIGDVRDRKALEKAFHDAQPEIVIHMAAQPLVLESYKVPAETFEINIMGTVNLLEAVRNTPGVRSVVIVTTDKCYENKERSQGYCEAETLGGYDPYSNSKACAELVTASYRCSFFNPADYSRHGVAVATARAGNVIGGGDWAKDRLIPDIIRSVTAKTSVSIRSPRSTRPWQHVLEPVGAYLLLAEKLYTDGAGYAEGWNIGPRAEGVCDVEYIVSEICRIWGEGASFCIASNPKLHEAACLQLDISKITSRLGWSPVWPVSTALEKTVIWYQSYTNGGSALDLCLSQISQYEADRKGALNRSGTDAGVPAAASEVSGGNSPSDSCIC